MNSASLWSAEWTITTLSPQGKIESWSWWKTRINKSRGYHRQSCHQTISKTTAGIHRVAGVEAWYQCFFLYSEGVFFMGSTQNTASLKALPCKLGLQGRSWLEASLVRYRFCSITSKPILEANKQVYFCHLQYCSLQVRYTDQFFIPAPFFFSSE